MAAPWGAFHLNLDMHTRHRGGYTSPMADFSVTMKDTSGQNHTILSLRAFERTRLGALRWCRNASHVIYQLQVIPLKRFPVFFGATN